MCSKYELSELVLTTMVIKYAKISKIMTRYECLVMPDMAAPLGWLS